MRLNLDEVFNCTGNSAILDPDRNRLSIVLDDTLTIMKAPPRPKAWQKAGSSLDFKEVRPDIRLTGGNLETQIRELLYRTDEKGQIMLPFLFAYNREEKIRRDKVSWFQWCSEIAETDRNLISEFSHGHWDLLVFLTNCGAPASDLMLSNPALAFALAANDHFRSPLEGLLLKFAHSFLQPGKKQRDILEGLGFRKSESAVKILRKVPHQCISLSLLKKLKLCLTAPDTMKKLCHLNRINTGVIHILADRRLAPYVKNQILEEISYCDNEDEKPESAHLLRECLSLFSELYQNGRKFPELRGLIDLRERYMSLLDIDSTRGREERYLDIAFPPPPLVGSDYIVPISRPVDLMNEGKLQKNCVMEHIEAVLIGSAYF